MDEITILKLVSSFFFYKERDKQIKYEGTVFLIKKEN